MKNQITFGSPVISEEDISEVLDTLRSGWIGPGPKTELFEEEFRKYIGSKYAITTNSCTSALLISLSLQNIQPGDEIITSPITFAATVNVIDHLNCKPVFADVDPATMNINPAEIEKKISSRTKAIIPVHLAGRPCEMDYIKELSEEHNLKVIEDAAHAIEASYKGKKIGTMGTSTCFSFYVTKNITSGDGGIITTEDKYLAENARILRNQGITKGAWQRFKEKSTTESMPVYDIAASGYKATMTDMQASLIIHQLKKINEFLKIREKHFKHYNEEFENNDLLTTFKEEDNITHARHLYQVLLNTENLTITRDQFRALLQTEGIGSGVHFIPVHLSSYYQKKYKYVRGSLPNAEYIGERTVSLPLSQGLSDEDIKTVITAVKKILQEHKK